MNKYFESFYENQDDFLIQLKNFLLKNKLSFTNDYQDFLIDTRGRHLIKTNINLCLINPNYATGDCPFFISVDEIFGTEELDEIWENTKEEIPEDFFPIGEVSGGSLILIGINEGSYLGQIFYLSFDFGLLKIANNIQGFFELLKT